MGKTQETIKSTKKIKDPIERVKNQKSNIDRSSIVKFNFNSSRGI